MTTRTRTFWRIAIAVIFAATLADYAPVLSGKVPFPAQLVFDFPPFARLAPPGDPLPYANVGDLVSSFYPYRVIAARAVREGSIPLWNPYMLSGAPFLANTQSAVFYPLTFVYYFLPVPVAWALGFPIRVFLAALFMILFVRRIGGSPGGAVVSGLLFAFCGFFTAYQGQAMADAAMWLPLIWYSVVRLHSTPDRRSIAISAVAFALPILAGHPETALHLTLSGAALALFLFIWPMEPDDNSSPRHSRRFVVAFAAAGLVSAALASVQLLATAEWLRYLHHSYQDPWPPLPLWSVLSFVSRDILHPQSIIGLLNPEYTTYIGMIAFVAAPIALLHRRRAMVLFLGFVAVVSLTIAYGIGPLFWLAQHAPVLRFMKNERLILLAEFSLAALGGLGVSVVELPQYSARALRLRAALFACTGVALAFSLIWVIHALSINAPAEPLRVPRATLLFLVASAAIVAWRLFGGLKAPFFTASVVALAAIEMVTFAFGFLSFVQPGYIFPPVELFNRLERGTEPFRIGLLDYAYGANFEAAYGLSATGGYELHLERLHTFLQGVSRAEMDSTMLTTDAVLAHADRRIDMLNTKYFMVSEWDRRFMEFHDHPERFKFLYIYGETDVYENLAALPPAFIVPGSNMEVIPNEEAQLARVKSASFDPLRAVVLEERAGEGSDGSPSVPASGIPADIQWVERWTNSFRLKVETPQSGVLVVSQIFYPGWHASVDGREVPVVPADYALSAIPVPAGKHDVRFFFLPRSFIIGLSLTIGGLIAAVLLLLPATLQRSNRQ